MLTRSAKAKGRKLQQWLRDALLDAFQFLLAEGDIKSATMGETGVDIQLSPLAQKYIPFAFECKSRKAFAVYDIMKQAEDHAKDTELTPVSCIKADRKRPIIMMYADDWISLITEKKPYD